MKEKLYSIALERHEENFSGLRMLETVKRINPAHRITPTVKNVKQAIQAMFPDFSIDERWQTVAEQIADSAGCGYFTIDLQAKEPIDFETWSASFEEV